MILLLKHSPTVIIFPAGSSTTDCMYLDEGSNSSWYDDQETGLLFHQIQEHHRLTETSPHNWRRTGDESLERKHERREQDGRRKGETCSLVLVERPTIDLRPLQKLISFLKARKSKRSCSQEI